MNTKLFRLLDVFSGAGGSAVGYSRVGFAVYGIDNRPQPHYPFPFLLMDALEAMDRLLKGEGLTFSNGETLYLADFDAYHASPPCQDTSRATLQWRMKGRKYPQLIAETRSRLVTTGKPYVIENVCDSWPLLINPTMLCGTMFGLTTYRHRLFETSFPLPYTLHMGHGVEQSKLQGAAQARRAPMAVVVGHPSYAGEGEQRKLAMGIDWMSQDELAQAIPPSYTEYIGKYLMQTVREQNA